MLVQEGMGEDYGQELWGRRQERVATDGEYDTGVRDRMYGKWCATSGRDSVDGGGTPVDGGGDIPDKLSLSVSTSLSLPPSPSPNGGDLVQKAALSINI